MINNNNGDNINTSSVSDFSRSCRSMCSYEPITMSWVNCSLLQLGWNLFLLRVDCRTFEATIFTLVVWDGVALPCIYLLTDFNMLFQVGSTAKYCNKEQRKKKILGIWDCKRFEATVCGSIAEICSQYQILRLTYVNIRKYTDGSKTRRHTRQATSWCGTLHYTPWNDVAVGYLKR